MNHWESKPCSPSHRYTLKFSRLKGRAIENFSRTRGMEFATFPCNRDITQPVYSGNYSRYITLTATCKGICFAHPVPTSTSFRGTSTGTKAVTTQGKTSTQQDITAVSRKIIDRSIESSDLLRFCFDCCCFCCFVYLLVSSL